MSHIWKCPVCGETTDEPAFTLSPFDMGVYCPTCPQRVELDVNPEAFSPEAWKPVREALP
jgi:hypothetical protein